MKYTLKVGAVVERWGFGLFFIIFFIKLLAKIFYIEKVSFHRQILVRKIRD